MRVPWQRFRKAYEEYPRWQALALWAHAITDVQDSFPPWLITDLQKRCPGFIEHETSSLKPRLTGLRLLEWLHTQKFAYAREHGWLDALIFYGVRHLRSQATWAYWEHCEDEWSQRPPSAYPQFEEWLQSATTYGPHSEKSVAYLADIADRYVEWRIFCRWLEPLIRCETELAENIARELERRCPEILELNSSNSTRSRYTNAELVRHLMARVEDRFFGEAEKEDWIDVVRRHLPTHPLYVRVAQYSKHFAKSSAQDLAKYPSYARWRRTVENYKEK